MLPNKKTKIVCTIGPASSDKDVLVGMIKAGMNVARFNFSHGTHESNAALVHTVLEAAAEVGTPIELLLDLQGPKIRIGQLPEEGVTLTEGEVVTVQAGVKEAAEGIIPVPYERLATEIKPGGIILLADGTMELEVISIEGMFIKAKVLLGGLLLSRKGINVPNVALVNEALTTKDLEDLEFGMSMDVDFDFVAMSFVRSAEDILILKDKIKHYLAEGRTVPRTMAKIEMPEALENFDEILAEVDSIMVARGDLGLESPIYELPIQQKRMIEKCLSAKKFVITATEMLGSMQYNPRPTRAEVSDVANAVLDHTDATMLSGETAMGKYPVRTIQMMTDIITVAEASEFYSA